MYLSTYVLETTYVFKDIQFLCSSQNRQPLLGMSGIETLGILFINCKTIEMEDADGPGNCKINMSQKIGAIGAYYTNTDNFSKFGNEDKPKVTDNDNYNIKYFLLILQQ